MRASIAFLVAVAFAPGLASAQDMTFGEQEVEQAEQQPQQQQQQQGQAEGQAQGEAQAGGDVIGELAGQETGPTGPRDRAPRTREAAEEIYAVQQIYALRNGRVELTPSVAFTVNDPYVSHPGIGVGLNYWWTNVLAIGVNFLWYQGLENESDLNFHVQRSTRLGVPITEYQLGAALNFTYVPLYGKFAMFNEYIFQWDAYVVGGVGIMRTRPVPVIDPEIRSFDFDWRIAFNVGIGIRVFVTRFLSIYGELRDYAYLEQLESLDVPVDLDQRRDPANWVADSSSLTNNVAVHLGISLFFPFTFEYKLPK